jgi:hypothetical protein
MLLFLPSPANFESSSMFSDRQLRWKLTRQKRWLIYLGVVLAVAGWKFIPRPWKPSITLETPHYAIYSTSTRQQMEDTGRALELLYSAYSNRFSALPTLRRDHPKLKVKLFRDRQEFRRINPGLGWAEAFYSPPYCHAYFGSEEVNPYHWMLHEAVHQLNHELAHLNLQKWLEEGLATYFSTSRMQPGKLQAGRIDLNTYPVWWIDEIATAADLAENIRNGSVIPIRFILTNKGGPSLNGHFNLYYLHWWTLTYFLIETPKYSSQAFILIKSGGSLSAFEQCIGPVDQLQIEWHAYVRDLKKSLSEGDLKFFKSQKLPRQE